MSREEPWEPWASAMLAVGATNPRLPDRPSWRQLATRAGITTQTVINAARGEVDTEIDVIRDIAKALRVSPETVSEWIGRSRAVSTRYAPPAEADLLTERQRTALTELIRSIAADEQRAGEEHERRSAPITPEDVNWPYLDADLAVDDMERADTLLLEGLEPALNEVLARHHHAIEVAAHGASARKLHEIAGLWTAAWNNGLDAVMTTKLLALQRAIAAEPDIVQGTEGDDPAQTDYDLAARRGTPAHQPDTTTGEESQDPGGFEGA